MKKKLLILFTAAFTLVLASAITADDFEISQIDTNRLLFRGEIDLYFTSPVTPEPEDLSAYEKTLGELKIKSFDSEPNRNSGIDFLLLIDNSGSMYEESYQGSRRITQAKLALNTFINQIDDTKDRAAVYAFNTGFTELAPFGSDPAEIRRSLSAIEQPEPEMAYTELYNSLRSAAAFFPKDSGRRAVIVLSDGENYSIMMHGETESPEWGTDAAGPDDVIRTLHEAGITLDGINIAVSRDAELERICTESGGKFHDVRSTAEISKVYSSIREKILNEYRITVTAPPFSSSRGEITLGFGEYSDSRDVLVPVLFGGGNELPLPAILLILLCGLGGIAVLYLLPFERPVKNPQLQALGSGGRTILNEGATIIGASRDADMTLAGSPGIDAQHATILHDENTGVFTLVSDKTVRVNNRKVKKRELSPGDVIRIEGSTIIFDAPEKS